ncbi:thioredoxin domain-containing protein [Ramlibacter sp. RBP-2]|uniref:Thioredoxin domain-containing protein n=1 Tax=Ramlibacter lithotrophicus TaxID=2606681 RepID=A0A7X6DE83_9BURK|nr:thioredoxin domain-containing protein [Ramlibacter lithotrophicus]NKE65555.1 thioredoxin domain-containing protein [Ramlibacter lithotrophicus]
MKRNHIFIAALVLLAVLFAGGAQWYRSQQAQEAAATAEKNRQSLVRPHSPALGRPDARVHIVEFFDPACETCAAFYPRVKQLMAAHRDDIRLTVRYAPFHQGSDEVVKALEASRRQGRYWQAFEALVAAQPTWVQHHQARPELIWPVLARAGVDTMQLRADMQAPEIAAIVAQDLADARMLNVRKTPDFFVNGRPLPSFGWDQLQTLVDEELAATAK